MGKWFRRAAFAAAAMLAFAFASLWAFSYLRTVTVAYCVNVDPRTRWMDVHAVNWTAGRVLVVNTASAVEHGAGSRFRPGLNLLQDDYAPSTRRYWGFTEFSGKSYSNGFAFTFPPALLVALPLLPWLVSNWRRRLRKAREARAGCCPKCGYDLRASPERCSECGRSVGQDSQAGAV